MLSNLQHTLQSAFGTGHPGSAAASSGGNNPSAFPIGSKVLISGLTTQVELNQTVGDVVFDSTQKTDGRFA
eukprot:12373287-Karenia_brevis.AAC.1